MRKMINNKNKDNDFLTAKETSGRLGIPLSTLYRLSKQGRIKSMRIGSRWYYPKSEIDKYLSCEQSIQNYPARYNELPERSDRRSYSRINCYIKCDCSIDLPQNNGIFKGLIKNISGGGLLLEDGNNTNKIDIDDPVKLKLRLNLDNNGETIIEAKGRIIRKIDNEYGIKFRNINKEYQNLIIQFVG